MSRSDFSDFVKRPRLAGFWQRLRRMGRPRLRVVIALFLLASIVGPPLVIETRCRHAGEGHNAERADPVPVNDPAYAKPEADTYLSFPQWTIVYAYADLASMAHQSADHAYSYWQAITDYWSGYCSMNRRASADGGGTIDQKATLYAGGLTFTADMAVRGLYEGTIGRFTASRRGPHPTREDVLAQAVRESYANFIRRNPWYNFPFADALSTLWQLPLDGPSMTRSLERRFALTAGWGLEGAAAWVTKMVAFVSPLDQTIELVAQHVQPGDLAGNKTASVVRKLPQDMVLIRTNNDDLTDLIGRLAVHQRPIVEVAGNQYILITALTPTGVLSMPAQGATVAFIGPIQSKPGLRRVGFDVHVPELSAFVEQLRGEGVILEHVYDYGAVPK